MIKSAFSLIGWQLNPQNDRKEMLFSIYIYIYICARVCKKKTSLKTIFKSFMVKTLSLKDEYCKL